MVAMLDASKLEDFVKLKFNHFSIFVEDEIFFPKANLKSILFRYSSTFLFTSISILFSFLFKKDGVITSYLLFFLTTVLSALVGGFGAGVVSSFIGVFAILLIFYQFINLQLITLFELSLFLLIGSLVSILIASAKRMDLAVKFNNKEKNYLKRISSIEDELNQAREEIKIRDEFISIASHELKTPLTTTLLKLQTALHNVRNVSLANFSVQNLLSMLESAELQTKRLSKMINDLLNVSLIRTGKLELELEEVDLSALASEIKDRFSERIDREKTAVSLDSNEAVIGKFDKLRIEQVFTNLISNALKYGNGKPISIKISKENSKAVIIIRDQGIGIPDGSQKRIFELFERGNHNNSYKGLGVGLYITNKIVEAHKGKIIINSTEGKGSTFKVELPLQKK